MLANYTWSKSLTNGFGFANKSGDVLTGTQLPTIRLIRVRSKLRRAPQYIDVPHIFNVVMAWDLPFGKGQDGVHNSVVDRLVGGWTIAYARQYMPMAP